MVTIESKVQPDVFPNTFAGLWWAVTTITSMSYGDIVPITVPGRVLSTIISFLGIGLVAIPTGIISAGFNELLGKEKVHSHVLKQIVRKKRLARLRTAIKLRKRAKK
jgi:voltage-gated potassium channel